MLNAKELRKKYFPDNDDQFKAVMDFIEKNVISAAKKHEESVIVKVPVNLLGRIKESLEDDDYTVFRSAIGRMTESLDDQHQWITIFWTKEQVEAADD